ncbi:SDR family oxidoreductase [Caulobacter vibrioides]|uniref:SDR family NAD(P)-dependent oxidoreductase n=1 Tax=Caulobacter vibrioides TaxID=155892 RepID=UPI000BB4B2DE|nr:SDR family oxidoreductase [Caulobacter vibrioides]ATC24773.1 SDR family NAD(P)-dependent oxidoreductase [Caulobacter vibrioides]AZH12934.1 SDR family oxidoreductase [Caulobacter vibrioides]PLR09547.1 NAD(P)-dependent oxidoreductase [Caulobacter vibrioides]
MRRNSVMPQLAMVTGAAQGIGRAIVERLGADGFDILALDADETQLSRSAADWREAGLTVRTAAVDCRDRAAVIKALDGVEAVDVLVNNAGISGVLDPIGQVDRAACDRVMGVNLLATIRVAQEAVRRMPDGGSVINIASRGYLGGAGAAHYVASKAAVVSLTRAMAIELRWRGVRVNAVAPGMVDTRMIDGFGDMLGALKRMEPTGAPANPAEIAAIVSVLAGPDASFVNGQILMADGGKSLGLPPL